eukprot:767031-Hanusia_phi.AAC.3
MDIVESECGFPIHQGGIALIEEGDLREEWGGSFRMELFEHHGSQESASPRLLPCCHAQVRSNVGNPRCQNRHWTPLPEPPTIKTHSRADTTYGVVRKKKQTSESL